MRCANNGSYVPSLVISLLILILAASWSLLRRVLNYFEGGRAVAHGDQIQCKDVLGVSIKK